MRHGGASSAVQHLSRRSYPDCLPAKAADYSQLKNWESTKLPSKLRHHGDRNGSIQASTPKPGLFRVWHDKIVRAMAAQGLPYVDACDPIRIP
jgi:hypothetical protein